MNKKIKKIFAVGIIIIMVLSAFTYYEDITEPQGIYQINAKGCCNYSQVNYVRELGNHLLSLHSNNFSYLGNKVDLMTLINPFPPFHRAYIACYNLSNSGFNLVTSKMWIHSESMKYPYSNMVITVTNYSLSINKPLFKNVSDNSGDKFGNYVYLNEDFGNHYYPRYYFCVQGATVHNISGKLVPDYSKLLNTGNYTFYQNITFTITVTLGIMHFTSQTYSIDSSW
ncbi:MAG: hypothetical protein ACYCSG_02155 [Thermoplasmataceae archaeon]